MTVEEIKEMCKKAGYQPLAYVKLKEWDDNYELVRVGQEVNKAEFFHKGSGDWMSCFAGGHPTIDGELHRKLKPGLEKIKVKE